MKYALICALYILPLGEFTPPVTEQYAPNVGIADMSKHDPTVICFWSLGDWVCI